MSPFPHARREQVPITDPRWLASTQPDPEPEVDERRGLDGNGAMHAADLPATTYTWPSTTQPAVTEDLALEAEPEVRRTLCLELSGDLSMPLQCRFKLGHAPGHDWEIEKLGLGLRQHGLTEFILARVAEDEEAARRVPSERDAYRVESRDPDAKPWRVAEHYNRHLPERVLVECGAMRCIVEECRDLINSFGDWDAEPDAVAMWTDVSHRERSQAHGRLSVIAAIWADHPDYREEWR